MIYDPYVWRSVKYYTPQDGEILALFDDGNVMRCRYNKVQVVRECPETHQMINVGVPHGRFSSYDNSISHDTILRKITYFLQLPEKWLPNTYD